MKILIIGASGLLAKPVIEQFDQAGHELVLFSRSVRKNAFSKSFSVLQGDVFNPNDLQKAMQGCDAVHLTISRVDEAKAMEAVLKEAHNTKIKLISYVSGATVAEENRWFPMTDKKFRAEQSLINSGIPFLIFRPTWFFESLERMVRDGRASIIGNQKNPYHWVSAVDFAKMVAKAYQTKAAFNQVFYVLGPEPMLMEEAMEKYRASRHPEIKKISKAPIAMLKFIAWMTRNKELKSVLPMFEYFEKVPEKGNTELTKKWLFEAHTTLDEWLTTKNEKKNQP
jgi:uncharacterized protein YbjT (DUF2867 family)